MICPKCQAPFETVEHDSLMVSRCTGCAGIWFDGFLREDIARITNVDRLDVGDERVGRQLNQKRGVQCPKCDAQMLRMADEVQFHIEFDVCTACSGTFFDAGELRDLSELTPIERLRKILDVWLSVR